ncbi:hypothetical protein SME46J_12870 [Serratia marcescens]|nr:hypothetical protein SME46J_12870 [Serratia marcescens]
MLENYFYDKNGSEQSDKVKREKAVSAALTIINSAAINTGAVVSLNSIRNALNEAADAIQASLEKE